MSITATLDSDPPVLILGPSTLEPYVHNYGKRASSPRADDLDAVAPHQANSRITDALIQTLGLPDTVAVARDIVETGRWSLRCAVSIRRSGRRSSRSRRSRVSGQRRPCTFCLH